MSDVCTAELSVPPAGRSETDLGSYAAYVHAIAARADGTEVIQNKTPAHASVIIASLFNKANKTVEIVCSDVGDLAYGTDEVIDAATAFVRDRHGSLTIVLESKISLANNKFLNGLNKRGLLHDIEIFLANPDLLLIYPFHFLVADGINYRFQADREKQEAIAQFGNPENALPLTEAFALILAKSTRYTPE